MTDFYQRDCLLIDSQGYHLTPVSFNNVEDIAVFLAFEVVNFDVTSSFSEAELRTSIITDTIIENIDFNEYLDLYYTVDKLAF